MEFTVLLTRIMLNFKSQLQEVVLLLYLDFDCIMTAKKRHSMVAKQNRMLIIVKWAAPLPLISCTSVSNSNYPTICKLMPSKKISHVNI